MLLKIVFKHIDQYNLMRYNVQMINNFSCKHTQVLYQKGKSAKFPPSILSIAVRKLDYLDKAIAMEDLKAPPGNRLERLQGDLENFWSIRINNQWRIIFRFENADAHDVAIVDYH